MAPANADALFLVMVKREGGRTGDGSLTRFVEGRLKLVVNRARASRAA